MAGSNPTGKASTSDYNVGRGKVYFASLDANGVPKGYRFLGNAPEFNISMETETLEHQASTGGLKVVDKEVVISQKVNLSLTLDEINFENMALFFSGTATTFDNSAASSSTPVTGVGNLVVDEQGRWFDLYTTGTGAPTTDSSGVRIYDIGTVTVTGGASGTDTAVENTDYELDSVMGRIFVIDGSTVLDVANSPHNISIAQNVGAQSSVDEVQALTQTAVKGALKFISENPTDSDHQSEFQFHQVSLKAEGDFGLISDEFTTMGLTGVAERNATGGDTGSPTLTIRTHSNA